MKLDSVVDFAARNIRQRIVQGRLEPGARLREGDFASDFDISRPPVREAFKVLEAEGLILRKPRRGAFVAEITEKDIWEVVTVKAPLYVQAVDMAMDKFTEEKIGNLQNVFGKMEDSTTKEPPDINKYVQYHQSFHDIILQVAGNGRLTQICSSMNNQLSRFNYLSFSNTRHLLSSCQRHKQILEAIKDGDKELAKKVTYEHVMEGFKNLQRIVRNGEKREDS
jgi:DNA-binding GntR family transcriptional regulator